MKKFLIPLIYSVALVISACSPKTSNKDTIVTTFYPVYEFTKQIAGDELNVEMLIPAGTDVHNYEPSTKDMAKIQDAKVFVYLDPNMEMWVKKVAQDKDKVIQASKDMVILLGTEEHDHAEGEHHNHVYDPHLWLSPYRAIKLVENIRDDLIEKYPDKKEIFTKNAEKYLNKLKELDSLI